MTEVKFRYETPSAFRKALKDRFGQIARTDRRYSLDELQRQFGYDRALARLFSSDDAGQWVLKGAGALLARLTTARHSKDVDMFFDATNADVVAPLTPLEVEGLIRPHYRVFPLPDHLADKLCATVGAYPQSGQPASSSRVKDLVDIAIIAVTQTIDSKPLRTAVTTNAALRGLELPERFAVTDPVGWAARYPRVAAEAPGPVPDYDTAMILASQIFDPILGETATGTWDPSVQAWLTT